PEAGEQQADESRDDQTGAVDQEPEADDAGEDQEQRLDLVLRYRVRRLRPYALYDRADADQRQDDAEHRREIAAAHAGRGADFVLLRQEKDGDADNDIDHAGGGVFFPLDREQPVHLSRSLHREPVHEIVDRHAFETRFVGAKLEDLALHRSTIMSGEMSL